MATQNTKKATRKRISVQPINKANTKFLRTIVRIFACLVWAEIIHTTLLAGLEDTFFLAARCIPASCELIFHAAKVHGIVVISAHDAAKGEKRRAVAGLERGHLSGG